VRKENISTLADAAGIDLTMLPDVGPQTADWIDAYANAVPADDPTLIRLKGWLLYRQGKLEEARLMLEKIPDDPVAQLGRARIFLDEKNKAAAAALLQTLYTSHPSGLLGLQVARHDPTRQTDVRGSIECTFGLQQGMILELRQDQELDPEDRGQKCRQSPRVCPSLLRLPRPLL